MQLPLRVISVLVVMIVQASSFRFTGWKTNYQHLRKAGCLVLKRRCSGAVQQDHKVFTSISFFRFTNVGDAQIERTIDAVKTVLLQRNVKGTLLLSNEGYNGQFAVPVGSVPKFCAELESVDSNLFGDLDVNIGKTVDYSNSPLEFPFKRLIVRRKKGALTDGLSDAQAQGIDWTQPGPDMAPEKWHEAIRQFQDKVPVVLDCRNAYESDVGAFENAVPVNTTYFSETWDKLHAMLDGVDRGTPLLTYCTGGIRCVKVNAYLQQKMGFTNTHRLQGGIIAYEEWVHAQNNGTLSGSGHEDGKVCTLSGEPLVDSCASPSSPKEVYSRFLGENFLFDRRRLGSSAEKQEK